MTQPESGSEGCTPRLYEAEVYARVAGANARKNPWVDPDWQDPAAVAGKYSIKSRQMYEAKLAAEGTGYRPGMAPSDVLYRSMPHEQMISMVHDGVSAQDVDEKGQVINKLGNAFKAMSATLRQAVTKEQAGWQGAGAEAAFRYLGGLAKWSDMAGDAAFLTANRYSQTSAAVANAQNSMPEPAGRSFAQSMDLARQQFYNGDFLDGIAILKDAQNQATLQFQAQQQAAAVLTARDQTLHSAASTQPMYTAPPPPPQVAPAPAGTTPGPVAGGSVESVTVPDVGQTTAASADVSAPTAGAGHTPSIAGGGGSTPTGPVEVGATAGPAPRRRSLPGPGTDGGWSRSSTSTLGPGLGVGGGLVPRATDAGSEGERGGSSRGSGGSGNSSGRATGRAPNGATEEKPMTGKRSGSGAAEPGAKAAAEATRAGATGKAGKTGVNGIPGAAGGKKSEEGEERRRSGYVVDGNPNETYGLNIETDERGNKIAPPVIGT